MLLPLALAVTLVVFFLAGAFLAVDDFVAGALAVVDFVAVALAVLVAADARAGVLVFLVAVADDLVAPRFLLAVVVVADLPPRLLAGLAT